MIESMSTPIQDRQEPTVPDLQGPDGVRDGSVETVQDIADVYRSGHRDGDSVLIAVEELLLELGEAMADRAARESMAGQMALARRTLRFERHVHELYRLAETPFQAQMAATALGLGAPQWLFEGEDGTVWRREITALTDYASSVCPGAEDPGRPRGLRGRFDW